MAITQLGNFSKFGENKLNEMAENEQVYLDYLKFQGRIFKHPSSIALEFFAQRPDASFVASKVQWEKAGFSVAQGEDALQFRDKDGSVKSYYDFNQTEQDYPPHVWNVNASNIASLKKALNVPDGKSLVQSVSENAVNRGKIASSMERLGIPASQYSAYAQSFLNAVQYVVSGRIELGGARTRLNPNTSAFKMLTTNEQRLAFLSHVASSAREALMNIERSVESIQTLEQIERNEKNDLRRMEQTDGRGTGISSGRGTAGSSDRTVRESSDKIESNENEKSVGMGNNTADKRNSENNVVSEVQNEEYQRNRSDIQTERETRNISDLRGNGTVDRGRTTGNIRNEMDEMDGGELSGESRLDDASGNLSDNSEVGGDGRNRDGGNTGQAVQSSTSPSVQGLRSDSSLGENETVRSGERSDEGRSSESRDNSITEVPRQPEKINPQIIFQFEQNGETRYRTVGTKRSISEIIEKASEDYSSPIKSPFVRLSHTGKGLSVTEFAELEQRNDTVSISINLDSKTALIFMENPNRDEFVFTEDDAKLEFGKDIDISSKAAQLTENEKLFLRASNIEATMAKSVLAWDEIEDLGYIFFEDGYIDKYPASNRASYGFFAAEKDVYTLAEKRRNGEDIRADLTRALLGNQQVFRTQNDNTFQVIYNKNDITAIYGNATRNISYEAVGDAFFNLFEGEYKEIAKAREEEKQREKVDTNINSEKKSVFEAAKDRAAAMTTQEKLEFLNNTEGMQSESVSLIDNTLNDILSADISNILKQAEIERESETDLGKAKKNINEFCQREYGTDADFSDMNRVDIAYKTDEESGLEIQTYADLENFRIIKEYDRQAVSTEQYDSLDEMNNKVLENLEFGNLVYLSDEEKAVVNNQIETQRELHYGYLGNGVTVYDVSRTEHNDYPTVAHISDNGEINYRTDDLSDSEKSEIENYAQDVKNKFQESNINLISEDNLLYRSDSSISWAYYNADGNDGDGQFVVMTIDSDVIEDAAREYLNETNAFINHIYENSTTTIADKGTAEFDSYFNDFYHYYSSDTVLPNTKKIKNDDERIISELISYANVKKLSETLGCSNEALTRLTDMSRFKLRGTGKPYDDTTLPQLLFENITYTVDVNKAKTYFDSISDEDAKKKADALIKKFVIKGGYDIDAKVDTNINSDKNDEPIEKLDTDFYAIYQIKAGEQYHNNRFASYDENISQGFIPNKSQYELVYEGNLKDIDGETINEVLENIYEKFNLNRPEDFTGHSLSMSDVITIGNEELTAHYVDRFGFHDVPSFFENIAVPDTHLVIEDFGIDLDFKDFYGLDLITRSESYSSDLDENGHVMKDHSEIKETVISYYYDNNEFYKSEFGYDDTKTDLASIKAEIIEFCEHMDSSDSISYHDKNGNDKTVEVDTSARTITFEGDWQDLISVQVATYNKESFGHAFMNSTGRELEVIVTSNADINAVNELINTAESNNVELKAESREKLTELFGTHEVDTNINNDEVSDIEKAFNEYKDIQLIDTRYYEDEYISDARKNRFANFTLSYNEENGYVLNADKLNSDGSIPMFPERVMLKVYGNADFEEIKNSLANDELEFDTIASIPNEVIPVKNNDAIIEKTDYLAQEVMRGTGFEDGKFRVYDYVNEKHPTTKELAEMLKNEHGIGGHSGYGDISFVDYDSKGIQLTMSDNTKQTFNWNKVAKKVLELVNSNSYITEKDIEERLRHAEYVLKNVQPETDYDKRQIEKAEEIIAKYSKIEVDTNINSDNAVELTVYHGTTAPDFTVFRPDYRGAIWTSGTFDDAKRYAGSKEESKVLTCTAKLDNPAHITVRTEDEWDIDKTVKDAVMNGNDGIIIDFTSDNEISYQHIAVLDASKIEIADRTHTYDNSQELKVGDVITIADGMYKGTWEVEKINELGISFKNAENDEDSIIQRTGFDIMDFGVDRDKLQQQLGYEKVDTNINSETVLDEDDFSDIDVAKIREALGSTSSEQSEFVQQVQADVEKLTIEVDTNINSESASSDHSKRRGKTRAEKLYDKFEKMFPDIVSGEHTHERYGEYNEESAYEPLSVEYLGGNLYSFMTSYVQNGDVMRDPDFTFYLDKESRTITMHEYQQDGVPPFGTVYQCTEKEDGTLDAELEKALSKNFMQNLKAAEMAERELSVYTDNNDNETRIAPVVSDDDEIIIEEEPTEPFAEYRGILNEFAREHNLGELDIQISGSSYSPQLSVVEKFGEETFSPIGFTVYFDDNINPYTLKARMDNWINGELERGYKPLAEREVRQKFNEIYGTSEIPADIPMPEISYASNPRQQLIDNVNAIQELKRLQSCEENGTDLYVEKHPKYSREKTKEESDEILRRYSGWGGLQKYFEPTSNDYYSKQLKELLTEDEYKSCLATVTDAHYTPQYIIDAMYKAIQSMDLPDNSRVLEPSCGTGNFISRMPSSIGQGGVVGVEIDGITAEIAKYLHNENEKIEIQHKPFERSGQTDNSFDLVIGNVPFGNVKLSDPDYSQNWLIHDSFFRKSLDKVAPGGIVAFITDKGTMDKKNPKVREYLATKAELVGAVRLPNTAFVEMGAGVTSDIIFLKKREQPLQPHDPKPDWCYVKENKDGLKINSYFVDNPQMMLGTMRMTSFQNRLTCDPIPNTDLKTELNSAISKIKTTVTIKNRAEAAAKRNGELQPWGRTDSFQFKDGKFYFRENENMNEVKVAKANVEKMKALIEIRETLRTVLDKQITNISDSELEPYRQKLNEQYDNYVKKFGTLQKTAGIFKDDIEYPIIAALEDINDDTLEISKASIFFERTVKPVSEIESVNSIEDAFEVSLDMRGRVDIEYMATLLMDKYPEKELGEISEIVCSELLEKNLVYIDPEKQMPNKVYSGIVEASEYLSGNVREKLIIAKNASQRDADTFSKNVEALKEVIPEDIHAEEIDCKIGATWVEASDYEEFLRELSGRSSYHYTKTVKYSELANEFSIINAGGKKDLNPNEKTNYGTEKMSLYEIAERLLNQKRIVVTKAVPNPLNPSKTITRTDQKETKLAMAKAKEIKKAFKEWIFKTPERREKYEEIYNRRFNSIVGRKYDGSHLTFNGMSKNFNLLPHQRNCVARAIYGGNTLAAHVVGAGKSAVMTTAVMKKKQLGLINKACIVVPKQLTEQTAREFRKVYPDAKLLTVTNKDLSTADKRHAFTAKIATGKFDAVVMSMEQFEKMAMSTEYQVKFCEKQKEELVDMLNERKKQVGNSKNDLTIRKIQLEIKKLEARLDELLNPKSKSKQRDKMIEFEKLGFDYLVVDEAHNYKNGFVATKMCNVAGVSTKASGRANDMQMKCDYFNSEFGNGHILMATGTPISNSMTEMYVMTRYLRPDLLEQQGVKHFDAWAATFGECVTQYQETATGQLQLKTSFSKFSNLPELMGTYKEFADVQTANKLNLARPELKGGEKQLIVVEATPEQKAYVKELAERAERIHNGEVRPTEDNFFKLNQEARLVGLGNAVIEKLYAKREKELPDSFVVEKNSKVDACINKVFEIYEEKNDTKGVQIIFSDDAVNGDEKHFSIYDYIKSELIERGVPEGEIVYAPKSDEKNREDIFRDINNSKYRVVIASTKTLGTGANIQKNLCALHNIDIPYKPADFEQREGRILRQGNQNKEVEIFNYVTKGTLDSYLYQIVTNKAKFIGQTLDDECPARASEDFDDVALAYSAFQAAALDDERIQKVIELKIEVAELGMLRNEYNRETGNIRKTIAEKPELIERAKIKVEAIERDIKLNPVTKNPETNASEIEIKTETANIITGNVISGKEAINEHINQALEKKSPFEDIVLDRFEVGEFKVAVHSGANSNLIPPYIEVKSPNNNTYTFEVGTDNATRLINCFEKIIPGELAKTQRFIENEQQNLVQLQERYDTPFPQEDEYTEKSAELEKLEREVSGLNEAEDVVVDPEEDLISAEDGQEKEETANTDDDDLEETEEESMTM